MRAGYFLKCSQGVFDAARPSVNRLDLAVGLKILCLSKALLFMPVLV